MFDGEGDALMGVMGREESGGKGQHIALGKRPPYQAQIAQ